MLQRNEERKRSNSGVKTGVNFCILCQKNIIKSICCHWFNFLNIIVVILIKHCFLYNLLCFASILDVQINQ